MRRVKTIVRTATDILGHRPPLMAVQVVYAPRYHTQWGAVHTRDQVALCIQLNHLPATGSRVLLGITLLWLFYREQSSIWREGASFILPKGTVVDWHGLRPSL